MTAPKDDKTPTAEGQSAASSDMDVGKVHGAILREKEDPSDGYEPVSLWLITFSFALIFWGGMYLVIHSGGFRADVFNSNLVTWDGAGAAKDTGPPDPMVVGKRIFTQNCAVCHQTTGLGVEGQFPPLVESEWVLSQDWHGDNHLVKLVLSGLQGPVTVKGRPYNNAMTAFGEVLDDDQISAVLTYVRNEWGNAAPPIPPEFVASIRAETADRKTPWTQPELQAIERTLAPAPAADATPADDPDAAPPAEAAPSPDPGATTPPPEA
jgi:mono/diheme cytochrome c family protein